MHGRATFFHSFGRMGRVLKTNSATSASGKPKMNSATRTPVRSLLLRQLVANAHAARMLGEAGDLQDSQSACAGLEEDDLGQFVRAVNA